MALTSRSSRPRSRGGLSVLASPEVQALVSVVARAWRWSREQVRTLGLAPAVAVYCALAAWATWPLVTVLGRGLAGDERSDAWKHAWGCWWFFRSLVHDRVFFPTRTALLGHPDGGSLYNIDPINSLLSVPLQGFLPLSTSFNLLVLFDLVAGATACYLLVRILTGDSAGALVSGAVYAFCPFVLSYSLSSGVTETLNLCWMPLFLLSLERVPRGTWVDAALAGALLGITAVSCWYFGLFAMLWAIIWTGALLLGLLRTEGWRATRSRMRDLGLKALVIVLLCVDVMSPALIGFWMTLRNPDSQHPQYISMRTPDRAPAYLAGMEKNCVAATDFLARGKSSAVVSHILDRLVKSAYVGWVVLGLAVLGLVLSRAPGRAFWLVSALVFAVLSLGPGIRLARDGAEPLWNPLYALCYHYMPGFTQVAIPYRLCVPTMLCLGVLAGMGVQWLLGRAPGRVRPVASVALACLVVAEFLYWSPAPHPLPVIVPRDVDACRAIAAMPKVRGVLDLPADWLPSENIREELEPGEYFYHQTVHGKPIPYRVSGHMSPQVEGNALVATLRAWMVGIRLEHEPTVDTLRQPVEDLRSLGIDVIVLHGEYLPPAIRAKATTLLEGLLGKPARRQGDESYFFLGGS